MTLPSAIVGRLDAEGLSAVDVETMVRAAVAEDLAGGVDVTSQATVPAEHRSRLELVARAPGVVAGLDVAAAVFAVVGGDRVEVSTTASDGEAVARGEVLVSATGPTRDLLTAERTALNLVCHLSGIATLTRTWVEAVAGTSAKVRDTRKTTPGLRALEKYAVRCGGGVNHRMSLSDAALVKDNHVVAAGGVAQAFAEVRRMWPGLDVEVEVDSLEQLDEVLDAGADLVLLDNFSVEDTMTAVQRTAHRARLESSGGLSLKVSRAYARTGVDFLAVGALTHSAPVLDIGADLHRIEGH